MAQLNLNDFSEQDKASIKAGMRASQYEPIKGSFSRGVALTAQGISDGVAGMVGLPSDLIRALLRKGGFDVSDQGPLGTESIKSALTYLGARPEIQAKTTTERYIRRIAEEFGYAIPLAIPIFGMGARAARLGKVSKIARRPYTGTLKRTRELGRKMLTDPPLQRGVARVPATTMGGKLRQAGRGYLERIGADPMGSLRREGVAVAAAGAGAQTGRELFPDSLAAEITGQFLGPAGLMALKYVPTPLRLLKRGLNIGVETAEKTLDDSMRTALKQVDPRLLDPNLPGNRETLERFEEFMEIMKEFGLDFDMTAYDPSNKALQHLFRSVPFTPTEIEVLKVRYIKNADTIEKLKVFSNDRNFEKFADSAYLGPIAAVKKRRLARKIEGLEEITTGRMVAATEQAGIKRYWTGIEKQRVGDDIRTNFINNHEIDVKKLEEVAEGLGLNVEIPISVASQKRIIEIAEDYNKFLDFHKVQGQIAPADYIQIDDLTKLLKDKRGLKSVRGLMQMIGREEAPFLAARTRQAGASAPHLMGLSTMKRQLEDVLDDIGKQADAKLAFMSSEKVPPIAPELAQEIDPHGKRYIIEDSTDSAGNITGKQVEVKGEQKGLFWDSDTKTSLNPGLLERELAYREYYIKEYLSKWRTGLPVRVRSQNRYGNWSTPSEIVASSYWGTKSGSGAGNIRAYLRVFPEGRPHLEAALMDDLYHHATIDMGRTKDGRALRVFDPDRFNKWLFNNESRNALKLEAMGLDPDQFLLKEMEVMKGLQQRMQVLKNRKEVINKNAMLKSLSGYAGTYNVQPTKEIIDAVKDPSGNKMRAILSIVRGNEAALQGVKESVWNFAMKLDTPQMGGFLEDNKNALSLLFAPTKGKMVSIKGVQSFQGGIDHIERMERILSARIMHESSYIPSPTGAPETRFKEFEQFMGQSFPSISNQVWTLYSRFLPARIVVARMMSSIFRRMSTDKWNDVLKDLFLNPENSLYMDRLVRASNPYGEKISSLRRLHLNWMLLGLEPMSKNTLSRENLQSELPIQDYNKYKKQAEILRKRIDAGDFRRLPSITKRSTEFSVGP